MSDVTPSDPEDPAASPPPIAPMPPPPAGPPPGAAPPYGQPAAPAYGYVPVPVDGMGRPLAEWWQRLLAIIIDGVLVGIVYDILVAIIVGTSFGSHTFTHFGLKLWLVELIIGVGGIAYFALLEGGPRGQSVGQMVFGIAVRDAETGGAIGSQRAGIRMVILYPWLVLIWIPFVGPLLTLIADVWSLVCGLSPLWKDRRQGFHDVSQKTLVVRVR